MNSRSRNILPRTASLMLIFAAFAGLFFLYTHWTYEGRFWQNWYPLLISESLMSPELESEVLRLSGGDVVTKSGTVMEYTDYKDLESISLEDFSAGKGPYKEDPRIDPYMNGIGSYFNQNIYEILYLPSDKSPLDYQRLFSDSSLMAETDWILPDWNKNYIEVLLFASVLLLLCFGSLRFCVTVSAFFAAGLIVYAQGQNSVLLVLAVTALLLRLSVMGSTRFSWYFLLPFLPAAASFYMGLIQIHHLELTGLVILSFIGAAFWPERAASLKEKKQKTRRVFPGKDHALFEPVSLFERQRSVKSASGERPSLFLMSAALLCLFLGGMNLPGEHILPAGIPSVERSEGFWDYDGLVFTETSGYLPGASDYIKHRAYQESFIYGGSYSLPVPGSVISYEDYHLSDGRVFESNPSVLIFSESWYKSRLEQMADSGPGKLLASESSPPVISPRYSETVGISLQMLLVFAVFIIVFVLIHLSGVHHASEYSGIRSSGKFVLRRKQQAA
ncbi:MULTISPECIES: hypothetical protein [unclassified Oceanispirochaeta]|uniref:hypothetical protein n=1 Tax=unclassified Oceanispirochaeta TaxID=2635722 RepID=UPI0011C021D4|nr:MULTISPECIES: hypothetical protein [unclassified Oceanispirochaeta]MBF9015744.1 hypothetical protein [Oceanispirochaeta sp. M2]NPD72207.1 hypothetical protein [Oceanispirochaeta sp. M1]